MDRGAAAEHTGVMGRYLAVDEQGRGLRATWRPDRGFTNVSLWEGNVCVETFHLSAQQMGELIAFLGMGLGASAPAPPGLAIVATPTERRSPGGRFRRALGSARNATADGLDAIAARLRSS
jgi:hypothetical protein